MRQPLLEPETIKQLNRGCSRLGHDEHQHSEHTCLNSMHRMSCDCLYAIAHLCARLHRASSVMKATHKHHRVYQALQQHWTDCFLTQKKANLVEQRTLIGLEAKKG